MMTLVLVLVIASTVAIGLLAGASLDQSFKQLPARIKLGAGAFSRYSKAADLENGVPFYAVLGIGAVLLSMASAAAAYLGGALPAAANPVYYGVVLSVLHTLTTARAAPINFSQKKVPEENEQELARIQNRFARWQGIRCVIQVATFGVNLWALVNFVRVT